MEQSAFPNFNFTLENIAAELGTTAEDLPLNSDDAIMETAMDAGFTEAQLGEILAVVRDGE
jgi:hypothetical protein